MDSHNKDNIFKKILSAFFKICPKSGRIVAWKNKSAWLIPITGLLALVWFLIRVIPKPSRAGYPCQRIAAPLASGFIAWIVGIAASVFTIGTARSQLKKAHYLKGILFLVMAAFLVTLQIGQTGWALQVSEPRPVTSPVGEAKGTYPGRVVWAHNPDATNENCTNTEWDYYYQTQNTIQSEVDSMVKDSLLELTGGADEAEAWDILFKYYNRNRRGSEQGYNSGEEIVIKLNLCSGFGMTNPNSGGSYTKGVYSYGDYRGMPDVSPAVMLAILDQLVNHAGVPQNMIYMGDPYRPFFQQFYEMVHPYYPDVHYLDAYGVEGRTLSVKTADDVIHYSDKNPNGAAGDKLPQIFVDAEYMINISALKGHEIAGITLGAKNHYGSQARTTDSTGQGSASHLHYGLPDDEQTPGYGHYRNLVDLLGHKDLGGKTILSIIDGLWGGFRSIPQNPNKWVSSPFNNDWPSSLFMSQDPVAIEAVGFDFLREEYRAENGYPIDMQNPNTTNGVDDYLWQAASSDYWPAAPFTGYDPEGDGTLIGSLGVLDRWNNPADKKYSRNLDPENGRGIELIKLEDENTTFIAVNVAGNTYTSASGITYVADNPSFYSGGTVATRTSRAIENTEDDTLYLSERYGDFSYHFTVIPGIYSVTLQFAETYHTAAGLRSIDVSMEGNPVLNHLDIFEIAGSSNRAYTETFTVEVTDGVLNIDFITVLDNAIVNAIIVARSQSNALFAINSGGPAYTSAEGTVYDADRNFSGGTVAADSNPIGKTEDDILYHSERWGECFYSFPGMAAGTYSIKFQFAENYWSNSNERRFDVVIEGQTLINDLDIIASAGGKDQAYEIRIDNISVSDGTLNIHFTNATVNEPKICAFVVYAQETGNTPPIADAGADVSADIGRIVTLDGSRSYDPDNAPQTLTYTWTQTNGPSVPLSDPKGVTSSFTVPESGTYTFSLTVSDGEATDTDQVTIRAASGLNVLFAINSGGPAFTALDGTVYDGDRNFSGGNVALNSQPIDGTEDDTLYRSERWGDFSYSFPGMAAGIYGIKFQFAENYWGNSNERIFDVIIEGQTCITDLDIISTAGGKNKAWEIQIDNISVSDGTLNISFTNATVDQPKSSAFIVYTQSEGNMPPVAVAGNDVNGKPGTLIRLDGSGSYDPDNAPSPLVYQWTQTNGPSVVLNNAATQAPSFTPQTAGNYQFSLIVNDGESSSGTDYVNVNITDEVNLLLNGDFSAQFDNWGLYTVNPSSAANTIESGTARISINNQETNNWDIQLFQVVTLKAGKNYTLSFDLSSEAAPKNFKIVVEHGDTPWTNYYSQEQTYTGPAYSMQRFTVSWTQTADDSNSKIGFHFGAYNTNDIWLDNVVLIEK